MKFLNLLFICSATVSMLLISENETVINTSITKMILGCQGTKRCRQTQRRQSRHRFRNSNYLIGWRQHTLVHTSRRHNRDTDSTSQPSLVANRGVQRSACITENALSCLTVVSQQSPWHTNLNQSLWISIGNAKVHKTTRKKNASFFFDSFIRFIIGLNY